MTLKQRTTATGAAPDERHPTDGGIAELTSYLVTRFVVVLVVVMLVESVVVWVESVTLLPLLQLVTSNARSADTQATTSLFSLLGWLFSLFRSLVQGNYLSVLNPLRGSLAFLLLALVALLLVAPVQVGALVFARGAARRVRAVQEARERELALAEQQRSQFLTDIAHDLRTPLMAVSGMAHALDDGVVRDEVQRASYLRSICEKTDKLGALVSSVFEYTKLGSGAYELEREELDLPQLLLREAAVAYSDVEDAGMLLQIDVSEEPCALYADPVQLARVVANLLTNAVRHNLPGTEIALLLVRRPGVAYVVVADTGAPIQANPSDLFEPFSRGDAARADNGGSGLGLSICKHVADLHGYELGLVQPYGRFAKAFVLRCTVVG